MTTSDQPPPWKTKQYDEASRFQVENLLREARRQRQLPDGSVPTVCLLDPDGDVVRHLIGTGEATRDPAWACYHSELWGTERPHGSLGIFPCAVGAPYAVLVAEELQASGCKLVVSVTSAAALVAQVFVARRHPFASRRITSLHRCIESRNVVVPFWCQDALTRGSTRAHCATPRVATPQVKTYEAIALERSERA